MSLKDYFSMPLDMLVMSFARRLGMVGDKEHWSRETFVVRWRDPELRYDGYVTFTLDPDGAMVEARMKALSPGTDFSYDFQVPLLKPARKRCGKDWLGFGTDEPARIALRELKASS